MWFIYDNLTATVAAMTVLLILASIQVQVTRSRTTQMSRYMASTHAKEMASWMEEDIAEMGRNMSANEWPFEFPDKGSSGQSPTDSLTTLLTVYHDSIGSGGTEYRVTKEYELTSAGTRTMGDTTKAVWSLQRTVDGTEDGTSAIPLTYFDVQLLNRNAQPIVRPAAPDSVESLRIHFGLVSPFQTESTVLREIHRTIIVRHDPEL